MMRVVAIARQTTAGDERLSHASLKAAAAPTPNADWVARMLASHYAGLGAMPVRLGLAPRPFAAMLERYFPKARVELPYDAAPLDPGRMVERQDLVELFLSHGEADDERRWMAEIVATGCMGGDHLWQDLGLGSRSDLSALIEHNFPLLRAMNNRDMKWKKFFYRLLCVQEGLLLCRAPSCEVCDDYAGCFAPEE